MRVFYIFLKERLCLSQRGHPNLKAGDGPQKYGKKKICASVSFNKQRIREITFNLLAEGVVKLKSVLSVKHFCHAVLEGTTEVLRTIYFKFDLMLLIKKLIKLS